jgi:hypothetical protein
VPWPEPIEPGRLDSFTLIAGGARVAGAAGDALVLPDPVEHERRTRAGLGGVTSLVLLDTLMNLPLGMPVPAADLDVLARAHLARVPGGVIELREAQITRVLTPPLTVVAVLVRARDWRRGVTRASCFAPFAQRVLLLDREPKPELLWEASVFGVGVWVDTADGAMREVCPPAPFVRRYWKPAGWRFAERAYAALPRSDPRFTKLIE